MNNSFIIWFSIMFLFLFLEIGHPGFLYFLSFSCGALCAFMTVFLSESFLLQSIVFIIATHVALVIIHFFVIAKKNQLPTISHRSNLDALIGRKVIVFRCKQDPEVWQARVVGQIWLVKAIGEQQLYEGSFVIVDVQGCHLRVDSIK